MEYAYQSREVAENYTAHVFTWPRSIADFIVKYVKRNMHGSDKMNDDEKFDVMVDVGCGGGQSTTVFAPYFRSIVGTDNSESQIEKAKDSWSLDNVAFQVSPGEVIPAEDNTVDLITVAGAAHYLDLGKFTTECNRVLKPGGCVALFGWEYAEILLDKEFVTKKSQGESGFPIFEKDFVIPRNQFAEESFYPGRFYFDKHEAIYNQVNTMKKERIHSLKFDWPTTMEKFRKFIESIPFFPYWKASLKKGERFALDVALEKIRKKWDMAEMKESDIPVIITFSVFMVMLKK